MDLRLLYKVQMLFELSVVRSGKTSSKKLAVSNLNTILNNLIHSQNLCTQSLLLQDSLKWANLEVLTLILSIFSLHTRYIHP